MPDFPGKNRFVQAIQKMYAAVSGLETIAAKQIPNPEAKQSAQTTQGGDIEQREQNVLRYEWNRTAGSANSTFCVIPENGSSQRNQKKVTLTEQEKKEIKGWSTRGI